jgi:hypothetical protein
VLVTLVSRRSPLTTQPIQNRDQRTSDPSLQSSASLLEGV